MPSKEFIMNQTTILKSMLIALTLSPITSSDKVFAAKTTDESIAKSKDNSNEEKRLNNIRALYTSKKYAELLTHLKSNKASENEETYLIEVMTSPYCTSPKTNPLPKEAADIFAAMKLSTIKRNLYSIGCSMDSVQIIQKLGVDLATGENGFSPLVYASIRQNNVELFKYLLSHKAPLKDKTVRTPIENNGLRSDLWAITEPVKLLPAAVAEGNVDILRMLMAARPFSSDEISEALMAALGHEQIPAAEFLLTKTTLVNYQDAQKFTPLHVAAGNANSPVMTKRLLELGADPYLKNHSGLDVFDWVDLSANGEGGASQDFSKVQFILNTYKKDKKTGK